MHIVGCVHIIRLVVVVSIGDGSVFSIWSVFVSVSYERGKLLVFLLLLFLSNWLYQIDTKKNNINKDGEGSGVPQWVILNEKVQNTHLIFKKKIMFEKFLNQNLQSAIFKWAKELFRHFQICQNMKKQITSIYMYQTEIFEIIFKQNIKNFLTSLWA